MNVSDEGREAGQWRSRSRHVVHDNLTTVQAHDCTALGFRIRIRRVIPNGFLSLPRLPQRVVYVGVMVHEGMWIRLHALVFALRRLQPNR